jgi:hypothetical protein
VFEWKGGFVHDVTCLPAIAAGRSGPHIDVFLVRRGGPLEDLFASTREFKAPVRR